MRKFGNKIIVAVCAVMIAGLVCAVEYVRLSQFNGENQQTRSAEVYVAPGGSFYAVANPKEIIADEDTVIMLVYEVSAKYGATAYFLLEGTKGMDSHSDLLKQITTLKAEVNALKSP